MEDGEVKQGEEGGNSLARARTRPRAARPVQAADTDLARRAYSAESDLATFRDNHLLLEIRDDAGGVDLLLTRVVPDAPCQAWGGRRQTAIPQAFRGMHPALPGMRPVSRLGARSGGGPAGVRRHAQIWIRCFVDLRRGCEMLSVDEVTTDLRRGALIHLP